MQPFLSEQRIMAVVILVLTAGLVFSTFGLEFADLGGAFSPMFFPRIILVILLGLAALSLVAEFLATPARQPIQLAPVVVIALALIAYVLMIIPLGYFFSSLGMGIVILLALGLRNPVQVVLVPAAAAGALVALFNHVLKMPLPTSPFTWWF